MNRTTRVLLPFAVAALVLGAACSNDEATSDDGDASTTTAADGGTVVTKPGPISLKVGETATIELEANPTTGFQWAPAADPNGAVIHIVSDTYVAAPSAVVGQSGSQKIVIEGVDAGTTTLVLEYSRPWEAGVAAAETATYPITVT